MSLSLVPVCTVTLSMAKRSEDKTPEDDEEGQQLAESDGVNFIFSVAEELDSNQGDSERDQSNFIFLWQGLIRKQNSDPR